jgi:hypothetical protein
MVYDRAYLVFKINLFHAVNRQYQAANDSQAEINEWQVNYLSGLLVQMNVAPETLQEVTNKMFIERDLHEG